MLELESKSGKMDSTCMMLWWRRVGSLDYSNSWSFFKQKFASHLVDKRSRSLGYEVHKTEVFWQDFKRKSKIDTHWCELFLPWNNLTCTPHHNVYFSFFQRSLGLKSRPKVIIPLSNSWQQGAKNWDFRGRSLLMSSFLFWNNVVVCISLLDVCLSFCRES